MHWNMLAQRLCDGFDKINDAAPFLKFDNRLRLMKEHFEKIDADVIGLSEVDAFGGDQSEAHEKLT